MSDFVQGAMAGAEVNKSNPFNAILSSFKEAQARRYKEDQTRKVEEAELQKSLMLLQYKNNYDTALAKETETEKRKSGLLEQQTKGVVTEAQPGEPGAFEGTPFGMVGRQFKATPQTTPVYIVDPTSGQMREANTGKVVDSNQVPKGAKVVNAPTATGEKITMGSNLDAMEGLLNDMEVKLKDPKILLRNLNPFSEREFKAIVDTYDKTAAIAAGGKQLTDTELQLIKKTRPTLLDMNSPKAIEYKINKQREIIQNAKARLRGETGQIGQAKDPEFQKYLQAIGG